MEQVEEIVDLYSLTIYMIKEILKLDSSPFSWCRRLQKISRVYSLWVAMNETMKIFLIKTNLTSLHSELLLNPPGLSSLTKLVLDLDNLFLAKDML